MSRYSLAVPIWFSLGILTVLVSGTLSLAEEKQLSETSRDEEAEEAAISRTVQWGLADRNQIYFVFDKPATDCTMNDEKPATTGDIYFIKHGVSLYLPSGAAQLFSLQPEDRSRVTGFIKMEQCMFEIIMHKYVRNKSSDWTGVRTSSFENINNLDQREKKYMSSHGLSEGNLNFLFDAADEDDCLQSMGLLMVGKSVLLSEMPWGSKNNMFPAKSGPFERTFRIEQGNCKYEMTVKLYVKTGGLLTPVHARHLGGDDFER